MPFNLSLQSPPPCEECGYDPAFHGAERVGVAVGIGMAPIIRIMDIPMRIFLPLIETGMDYAGGPLARALASLGLATIMDAPDNHSSETAQALWSEAKARGIAMREMRLLGLPRRMFFAEYNGKRVSFEGLPRPARIQPSLSWIDDKEKMKARFSRAGFPVAQGYACRTEREAVTAFHKLRKPVIAKPHIGSGGRHTSVHIETEEELRKAFKSAKRLSPRVMIEEELEGPVFRPTLVGGKLIAVLRRDPPMVVGDGKHTIRELVEEENKNPLRRGPVFADISLENPYAKKELHRAGLTPESIPEKGREVLLHFKVNWGVGGTSRDATDEVHPDNKKLFEDVGRYLGDDIIGIDFMVKDISKSWKKQERCGIIECNSLPLIGNHHFPFTGKVQNVAGAVWDGVGFRK